MKKKIRVKDIDGKVIEGEILIRNLDHFEVQKKNRAQIFKPKKGKGSYSRKEKHKK